MVMVTRSGPSSTYPTTTARAGQPGRNRAWRQRGSRRFGPQVMLEQRYLAALASQGVAERVNEKTPAGPGRAADHRVVHEAAIQAVQRAAENRIQRGAQVQRGGDPA